MTINEYVLSLFDGVIVSNKNASNKDFTLYKGYCLPNVPKSTIESIKTYVDDKVLSFKNLNSTFYKTWEDVLQRSEREILLDRILNYITVYGSLSDNDFVYIPNDFLYDGLDVEEYQTVELKVIRIYTKAEVKEKVLSLLTSGVALNSNDVAKLCELIDKLNININKKTINNIKNKEAKTIILTNNPSLLENVSAEEILRIIVYIATQKKSTLLIKSSSLYGMFVCDESDVKSIKKILYDNRYKLSTIFNRFKPIFLELKFTFGLNTEINKISKLSKKTHKPMRVNDINRVTKNILSENSFDLKNATNFALLKAIDAINKRKIGYNHFVYRIRNGKIWYEKSLVSKNSYDIMQTNYNIIVNELKSRIGDRFKGKSFYIPSYIEYGLPTSLKMFMDNIPNNSKFTMKNSELCLGIYWKEEWGYSDLDLSLIADDSKKYGWNGSSKGDFVYSGDMTTADPDASEYFIINDNPDYEYGILMVNAYSTASYDESIGENPKDSEHDLKLIIGKTGNIGERDYVISPNDVKVSYGLKLETTQKVLGVVVNNFDGTNTFIATNSGVGMKRVSFSNPELSLCYICDVSNDISFNDFIVEMGGKVVSRNSGKSIDLSLEMLNKDTFVDLLS